MLEVNCTLSNEEAKLLRTMMERATDKSDFREQWQSDELKLLIAKVVSAVGLAEQTAA